MIKYIMERLAPKPKVLRDDALERVAELLFPALEEKDKDGITMVIDYSVDSNLQAALLDLEDGTNDHVVRDTIRKCIARIQEVRAVLEADHRLIEKARYLMVDVPQNKSESI